MTRSQAIAEIDAISARFAPMHEAMRIAGELNAKYPDSNVISREDYEKLAESSAAMNRCLGREPLPDWIPRGPMEWRGRPVEIAEESNAGQ